MRQTCIFAGSSHPRLADAICERVGKRLDNVILDKFSNGETSVEIRTSVRDQDVFIVQSGSQSINDAVMELLIMINACKGGSSRSITAVMPYFPYSRQSKRKGHRGSITARMVANLMHVAGVDHVITIDLHANQSQGFFKCPVDNLVAEPLLAKWIRQNVKDWQNAVVVSKNPGGTKRVTSLADALKLSFGIVTTDSRRMRPGNSLESSIIFAGPGSGAIEPLAANREVGYEHQSRLAPFSRTAFSDAGASREVFVSPIKRPTEKPWEQDMTQSTIDIGRAKSISTFRQQSNAAAHRRHSGSISSPLAQCSHPPESDDGADFGIPPPALDSQTSVSSQEDAAPRILTHERYDSEIDAGEDNYTDERARDVVTGRLVGGHLVEDDFPSPVLSTGSYGHEATQDRRNEDDPSDHMMASFASVASSRRDMAHDGVGLCGPPDADASDEEEEEQALQDAELETTITLVGNVRGRPVFIVDDVIDKAGSWIAAAETVVRKGGATEVYCMASHGLFGNDALKVMQGCKEINRIVVTNSFPIPDEKRAGTVGGSKLVELDVSHLLSEAIRRNHYGEATSQFYHNQD